MNSELWRPLHSWPDVYLISNLGRIKRIKKHRYCNTEILNPIPNKNDGYVRVHLRDSTRNEIKLLHRLVLLSFSGSPPQGQSIANHKNGIRHDNRLENLEWCNHSENNLHAFQSLNRQPVSNKGEAAGRAKLSDNDVLNIRHRYANEKISQQKLADEFNVSQNLISKIVLRQIWTHI